jgi:hypothetical protein
VLFKGTANAMRRQALPPLARAFAGRDSASCACSTSAAAPGASSISSSKHGRACPRSGIDLSEAYIRHARRHLRRWSRLNLVVATAKRSRAATIAATR